MLVPIQVMEILPPLSLSRGRIIIAPIINFHLSKESLKFGDEVLAIVRIVEMEFGLSPVRYPLVPLCAAPRNLLVPGLLTVPRQTA